MKNSHQTEQLLGEGGRVKATSILEAILARQARSHQRLSRKEYWLQENANSKCLNSVKFFEYAKSGVNRWERVLELCFIQDTVCFARFEMMRTN